MANGVVFEKNLEKLRLGLNAINDINKGFEKLAKLDKKLKMFDKSKKVVTQVQKGIKQITKENEALLKVDKTSNNIGNNISKMNFSNAVSSLNRFQTHLKNTSKQIDTIQKGIKGIGFAGLAGAGAIAGAGAMLGNFGKGFISNDFNAKALDMKGFGGRSYQALQNMSELTTGNKDYLAGVIKTIRGNVLSVDTSSSYATLGINQNEFAQLSWDAQLQKLLNLANNSIFDDMYNDTFRDSIENITGLNISELRALAKTIPNVTQEFNNALNNVASSQNIKNMEKLGKEFTKMQHTTEAFLVDSASGVHSGLSNAISGIGEGFNDLRKDTTYKAMLQSLNAFLNTKVNKNAVKETINNIPTLFLSGRSIFNDITSAINGITGSTKGFKNSVNDMFAKIGLADKTDKDTKHSELSDLFKSLQDKQIALESSLQSNEIKARNARRYGGNASEYDKNIQELKEELKANNKLQIEFNMKHEYINGRWEVKETEIKEEKSNKNRALDMLMSVVSLKGGG